MQGRSVAGCEPLCALADGMIFYFVDHMFGATSQQRHLEALGHRDLRESDSDTVIATRLDEFLNGNNYNWWLLFEPYRVTALYQKQKATRVLTVNLKSIEAVAT